jgi:alcohol dehydrogenase class IV
VSFRFETAARIVFGRGRLDEIGKLIAERGRSALVVSNADRSGKQGLMARIERLAAAESVAVETFWIRGEPEMGDVDRGLEAARRIDAEVIVGIGGGSAIDAAKAVAGLMTNEGTCLDYMEVIGEGRPIRVPPLPWIAVPATAGTGAEVTRNAVIGSKEHAYKASIRSPMLLARIALVDPEIGVAVPRDVTARTGMDALTQCVESYTSSGANAMTDPLALEGVARAGRSLRRAVENGNDLDAREDMALAALISGITLTNAGLGAVHGLAAPLGARFPVPHGAVCAALLPHVMKANIDALRSEDRRHPVLRRYAEHRRGGGRSRDRGEAGARSGDPGSGRARRRGERDRRRGRDGTEGELHEVQSRRVPGGHPGGDRPTGPVTAGVSRKPPGRTRRRFRIGNEENRDENTPHELLPASRRRFGCRRPR